MIDAPPRMRQHQRPLAQAKRLMRRAAKQAIAAHMTPTPDTRTSPRAAELFLRLGDGYLRFWVVV